MKSFLQTLPAIIFLAIVIAIVILAVYLDYHAYCLRFPHAPGWTYFFD